MRPDQAVATTRNIKAEGEAYDANRLVYVTLEEDITTGPYTTREGHLIIRWTSDGGPAGEVILRTAAIKVLRELLA